MVILETSVSISTTHVPAARQRQMEINVRGGEESVSFGTQLHQITGLIQKFEN